jgi:hypothetical protein
MLKRDNITVFFDNYFATTLIRGNFPLTDYCSDFFKNIANFQNSVVSLRRLQSKLPNPTNTVELTTLTNVTRQYRAPKITPTTLGTIFSSIRARPPKLTP